MEAADIEKGRQTVFRNIPVILAEHSDFTFEEMGLINGYVERADFSPEDLTATFSIEEVVDMLRLPDAEPETLERAARTFLSKVVIIPAEYGYVSCPTNTREWIHMKLFDLVEMKPCDNGYQSLTLTRGERLASELFFNNEAIGHYKLFLENTVRLDSPCTFYIYTHIWKNRNKSTWEIDTEKLSAIWSRAGDGGMINDFEDVGQKVLKKCINEINEKTDLIVTCKYCENKEDGPGSFRIRFSAAPKETCGPVAG